MEGFASQEIRKKGNSCIRKSEKRKSLYSIRTPSTFACLPDGVELEITVQYFFFVDTLHLSRGSTEWRAAAAYELLLVIFPVVVWTRFFSPHGFPGFWDSIPKRCKGVHCVDLGESFPTDSYSNEYLLAKIGVDTGENEPLEVWRKIQFNIHSPA